MREENYVPRGTIAPDTGNPASKCEPDHKERVQVRTGRNQRTSLPVTIRDGIPQLSASQLTPMSHCLRAHFRLRSRNPHVSLPWIGISAVSPHTARTARPSSTVDPVGSEANSKNGEPKKNPDGRLESRTQAHHEKMKIEATHSFFAPAPNCTRRAHQHSLARR